MKAIIALLALIITGCTTQPLVIKSFQSDKWNRISTQSGPYKKFTSLEDINKYVNSVPYKPEQTDDWKPPNRFYKEGGDCEDYAIAKYFLIKHNNVAQDANITLVFDTHIQQYHAVLLVGDKVLDNQYDTIQNAHKLKSRYLFIAKVIH